MIDNQNILKTLHAIAVEMEELGAPNDWIKSMMDAHSFVARLQDQNKTLREKTQYWPDNAERDAVIKYQKEEIERLRAKLDRATLKTERWRGSLVHVAQGRGDPVAVASKALELDNE